MEQFNIDAVLATIDRKEAELAAASRQISSISATARSGDGLVEVTVGGTGTVKAVHLAPETFRRSSPQYLGGSIVEATRRAAEQANRVRQQAMAPIAAAHRELTEGLAPARASRPPAAAQPMDSTVDAASTDRLVRISVNPLGFVTAVDISPNAFRASTPARLAAAITEAAQRAARQLFESRSAAIEPYLEESMDAPEAPDLKALYPIPAAVQTQPPVAAEPPTPAAPPKLPQPGPSGSTPGHVIPGTRRPNRDQVFIPDEPDDDDLYFQQHHQNGWLR
ncbi:YbaB/EbfC family nucleoid-associated protein [Nocardia sp. CA-129566]|uniref:YbaB/EbfC family nucleoid-associated protein n=1 Tax=Nocardia sp. CA-129566 TaxID=3239976 RepID=UPI003D965791